MDLANIAVRLRPRNAWEAIDLGCMLARHWFFPLWQLWMIGALPALLLLTLSPIPLWLAGLSLWWLKPYYEPILLFWLGRRLFGERPSWRELRQHWRRAVLPQLFANLTWRRFNPSRSFVMPVAVLEGLKGRARARRIGVLSRNAHAAGWFTITGILFEFIFALAVFLLALILVPKELWLFDIQAYFSNPAPLTRWLQQIIILVSMSLIAPFYVAGGFALYLNRRTELEAWDLELGLRRMAERHRRQLRPGIAALGALIVCLVGLSLPGTPPRAAEVDREAVQRTIREVLAEDAFGREVERTRWRYIGQDEEEDSSLTAGWLRLMLEGFSGGLAGLGELLLWLAGGAVLAYLFYWYLQNRASFNGGGWSKGRGGAPPPTHIAGLDLRPESLPRDPAAEAEALIESGDYRGALSLLYRGALSALVHRHALEIVEGATEGECLGLVRERIETGLQPFFFRLTGTWLRLAYGHRSPAKEEGLALCREWRGCFGGGDEQ